MIQQIIQNTEEIINRYKSTADSRNLSPADKIEAKHLMQNMKKCTEFLSCYPQNIHEIYLSDDDFDKMNKCYMWLESVVSGS